MKLFSIFRNRIISICFLTYASVTICSLPVAAFEETAVECYEEAAPLEEETVQSRRYGFSLDMSKGYLSGILILREEGEYTIGSIIGETGISAVDFRYDKKRNRLKLLNVVSFLDKWYIRKVISRDLAYSLSMLKDRELIEKKGYEVELNDNSIKVLNKKYNLKYSIEDYAVIE
ncbi:MAG: hypothetical protein K2L89_02845 [Muribaculaceae bacterium]|nr:hypothetical protein [Muribaculaceae bacterium]